MANLSIKYTDAQQDKLEEVLQRNPGWTKALVVRTLLTWFFEINSDEQEKLIKKYGVKAQTDNGEKKNMRG